MVLRLIEKLGNPVLLLLTVSVLNEDILWFYYNNRIFGDVSLYCFLEVVYLVATGVAM